MERIKIRKTDVWYYLTTRVLLFLQGAMLCESTSGDYLQMMGIAHEVALQLHEASTPTNCGSPVEEHMAAPQDARAVRAPYRLFLPRDPEIKLKQRCL